MCFPSCRRPSGPSRAPFWGLRRRWRVKTAARRGMQAERVLQAADLPSCAGRKGVCAMKSARGLIPHMSSWDRLVLPARCQASRDRAAECMLALGPHSAQRPNSPGVDPNMTGEGDTMSHCSVVVWHPAQPRAARGAESHAPPGGRRAAASSSGELVEKEIHSGNPAVPGNDEIRPGVRWRLTRAAFYPLDPPAIAHFLGLGDGLIAKVRVRRPDLALDAIDRVASRPR